MYGNDVDIKNVQNTYPETDLAFGFLVLSKMATSIYD